MRYQKQIWQLAVCNFMLIGLLLGWLPATVAATPAHNFKNSFYLGLSAGYGSTNWHMLDVYCEDDDNCDRATVQASAPITSNDDGFVWGFFLGYYISNYFAMESNFHKFHQSVIYFADWSFYTQFNNKPEHFSSKVYSIDLLGKFIVSILHTGLYGYATAGANYTRRKDMLADIGHINPTFGVGLQAVITKHWFSEFAFQYACGFGRTTVTPAIDYIPFLYSVSLKVAYQF